MLSTQVAELTNVVFPIPVTTSMPALGGYIIQYLNTRLLYTNMVSMGCVQLSALTTCIAQADLLEPFHAAPLSLAGPLGPHQLNKMTVSSNSSMSSSGGGDDNARLRLGLGLGLGLGLPLVAGKWPMGHAPAPGVCVWGGKCVCACVCLFVCVCVCTCATVK